MYLGSWKIDDTPTFSVTTHRFDTGAATDADSPPTYRVYEDETSTPILTGTMALLDSSNTAGLYSEQVTLSAANGFEKGKSYSIYITAAVNSVTGTAVRNLQIGAEVDVRHAAGTAWGSGAITAASIASDAITDAKVAADVTIASVTGAVGSVTGAVGSVTGNVGGNVTGSVGSVASGGITAASFAANALDAVWSTATRTLTAISDSSGITTLLARIIGTLASGTHNPQSGDAYARLGAPAGASTAADIAGVPAAVLSAADANPIASNIQEINDVAITGDGSGSPFDV